MKKARGQQLKEITICKCFLLLKKKFKINSIEAKDFLAREFFLSATHIQFIIQRRHELSIMALEENEKCLLLRKLETIKETVNPLFL